MRNIILVVALVATGLIHAGDSEWINSQIEDIKSESDYGYAWSCIMGWGNGSFIVDSLETEFEWIMYTNSDSWLQFRFSKSIPSALEFNLESDVENSFRVTNYESYAWLSFSNYDWIHEEDTGEVINKIDNLFVIFLAWERLHDHGFNFNERVTTFVD